MCCEKKERCTVYEAQKDGGGEGFESDDRSSRDRERVFEGGTRLGSSMIHFPRLKRVLRDENGVGNGRSGEREEFEMGKGMSGELR